MRTLLFDVGNTLVLVNWPVIREAAARRGVATTLDAIRRAELQVRVEMEKPDLVRGTTDQSRWFHYYGRILDLIGAPRSLLDELHEYHRDKNLWNVVEPGTAPLLDRLRRRFRLGAVSNSDGSAARVLETHGLAGYFEAIVDSHVVGVEKPDPRIFRIALERMGVAAEEAAYVGDIYHIDVVGARAAGLTPILLDPGDLHRDRDCRRIRELADLETAL